jgi:hypothetical protein
MPLSMSKLCHRADEHNCAYAPGSYGECNQNTLLRRSRHVFRLETSHGIFWFCSDLLRCRQLSFSFCEITFFEAPSECTKPLGEYLCILSRKVTRDNIIATYCIMSRNQHTDWWETAGSGGMVPGATLEPNRVQLAKVRKMQSKTVRPPTRAASPKPRQHSPAAGSQYVAVPRADLKTYIDRRRAPRYTHAERIKDRIHTPGLHEYESGDLVARSAGTFGKNEEIADNEDEKYQLGGRNRSRRSKSRKSKRSRRVSKRGKKRRTKSHKAISKRAVRSRRRHSRNHRIRR